ncbi:MAG: tetratricopeptide repeat protein [Candidatus Eisenbacteria bacterium]
MKSARLRLSTLALALFVHGALLPLAVTDASAAPARARSVRRPVKPQPVKPAPPEPAPARDVWREARGLADRGQPDSALALLREPIARDTTNLDLRWLEAGLTGESGRHDAAVVLYERLLAAFPDRANDLAVDLAAERQRAGDRAGAVRDYRAWLEAHPDDRRVQKKLAAALVQTDSLRAALSAYDTLVRSDTSDTESALERARVLGWLGRHREAISAFEAVQAREPANTDAALGAAQNLNWSGRHRRATHALEALTREDGANAEAWKMLAFARYWDDDADGARAALAEYRRSAPDDSEAVRLERRIAREHRSTLEVGFGRALDSDGLHVASPSIELRWPLAPRTTGMVGWRNDLTDDAAGRSDVAQLGAGLSVQWSAAWTTYANGMHWTWSDELGTRMGGEAGIVNRPFDHLRLEVVAARGPVITRQSLEQGISLLQWVAAADWNGIPRVSLHGDARSGHYSDGNRSERGSAAATVDAWSGRTTDLVLGASVDQLNVHQDLDHGYYDPDFHREWGPTARLEHRPDAHWTLSARARSGWQREKGGRAETFYGLQGGIAWRPDLDWIVRLDAGKGDSNLQTAAGYRREWWQFSVTRAF